MYFTPEDFFYVFIRLLSQVFIRDAPGISEKDENRSKSTKVTKVIYLLRAYNGVLAIRAYGPVCDSVAFLRSAQFASAC